METPKKERAPRAPRSQKSSGKSGRPRKWTPEEIKERNQALTPKPHSPPPRPQMDFDHDLAKFTDRQLEVCAAIDERNKYVLFGGALGGGKSYLLRWLAVRVLMRKFRQYGIRHLPVMLACEDYPTLKDRQISKIINEFPPWLGTYHDDHKAYGKAFVLSAEYGSGVICLRNLDDPSKFQSAEFVAILVDELTKNPLQTFTALRMRLRWPGIPDLECPFVGATNPGGVGHNYCKAYWITGTFPPEFIEPFDYRPFFKFIPSKADDNPHLDPSYWQLLNTLPENLRAAYRDGSWDVYEGQAFSFSREWHVLSEPIPIPPYAQLYTTFDWGFGAPFSWGWWWVDADGRVYRFAEWYGWDGTPNRGLRWEDSRVAAEIVRRERLLAERYGLSFNRCIRLSNPDCFQRKPDYRGGGQGPSTAEVFSQYALNMAPGDPSRTLKIRQFRERLKVPDDGSMPMMMVYPECEQFIRTIPDIPTHKTDPEEIDTQAEDHCLHGDTMVLTRRGIMAIRDMIGTVGDVLGLDGWVPYSDCKLTRRDQAVVKVTFSNGAELICTGDHRILTVKGEWQAVQSLTREQCLYSSVYMAEMESLSERADVYCLRTPYPHAFVLANGLIVHNCFDESALICMARPIALNEPSSAKTAADLHIDMVISGAKSDHEKWEIAARQEMEYNNRYFEHQYAYSGGTYSDVDGY